MLVVAVFAGSTTARADGPAAVNLGTAGNFVILSKTGISSTGVTTIVGDIGVSPAEASYLTGFALTLPSASAFSTTALVSGKVYAPGYADPTPTNLTTAIGDMQTAYTDAAGRAPDVTELGAGNIGGKTLTPGTYKWSTDLIIPTDVTISGSANDVWIFQIAQNFNISSGAKVILSGGAKSANIFWQVAGQTTIGTTAVVNGNILDQTAIVLNTGATLNGRALAQTAVTLDTNAVTIPSPTIITPIQNPIAIINTTSISLPAVCTMELKRCFDGALVGRHGPDCEFAKCPEEIGCTKESKICLDGTHVGRSGPNCVFEECPTMILKPINQILSPTVSFGQQVRDIARNLGQGHKNLDVKSLQQFLISQNIGPAARALSRPGATSYFGVLTRAALAEFQFKFGIKPAWGNFGPITRAYINANF